MLFADHRLRDVEVASLQLRRIYRVMRETLRAMCGHVPSSPSHPVKRILARHAWIDALHADALRIRVLELRYPRVDVDDDMPPAWLELLSHLPRVKNSTEFLAGVYSVVKPRVINAIEHYMAGADAIDDAPSHLILKRALDELKIELQEAEAIIELLPASDREGSASWATYLESSFAHLGGFELASLEATPSQLPFRAGFSDRPQYELPPVPARDPAYAPAVMQVPPRPPRNDVESRIWLAIDHANEMWAAELPCSMIWKHGANPTSALAHPDRPW